MSLFRLVQLCALVLLFSGCKSIDQLAVKSSPPVEASVATQQSATAVEQPEVARVAYEEETIPELPSQPIASADSVLTLPDLIQEVQARNPSLEAMAAAWQSAAQRYPQAISLDDPMFMAMAAPASFGSEDVESAYQLQASQKFPWFGKRAARGRQAAAEATAAFHDLEDDRLRLTEVTQTAYFEYYLVRRALELNRENLEVMKRFRSTAQARYRANQVTQQDELQADVELAELERQGIELERMDKVAVARINTLLRTDPSSPLPAPPNQLDTPSGKFELEMLQQTAEIQRPDLAAIAAKVRAEQAAVTLACKDYYPDADVFGRYDTFWQPAETQSDLRGQVGVTVNVPLYRGRLNAAVREAVFRLNQRRAEYEQRRLDIAYEVANAYALVEESQRTIAIYSEKLIPAAQQNIGAASTNYDVGKVGFLELATAQRQSIELRRKQQEALATYHSRLAALARAVGGPISLGQSTPQQPSPPSTK